MGLNATNTTEDVQTSVYVATSTGEFCPQGLIKNTRFCHHTRLKIVLSIPYNHAVSLELWSLA